MPTDNDILRQLATRWMELASLPIMEERRRLWRALKDRRAVRPMVNFETATLEDYVTPDELLCTQPELRPVEQSLRWQVRHVEEVGDDTVLEPYFRVHWQVSASEGYGVEIASHGATDVSGACHGYAFTHPIATPDDLQRLRPRRWQVDRAASERRAAQLQDIFGDILPVQLTGLVYQHAALTQDAYKLIGNNNLLMWPIDAPEAIHRLMAYLRDDRLAYFSWLEDQQLLGLNNNWTFIGSACGYTSDLPQRDFSGVVRLRDQWCWMESQETTMHSPEMFEEFFLPYMAEVANRFGLVYYGCCEPVHDRWTLVSAAIPAVRAVSVSPWCDMNKVARAFGTQYIFSRKPNPAPMSGATPDWSLLAQDLDNTLTAAAGCNLEIIFRDVYRINGDRPRLRRWVEMVRDRIEA